MLALEFLRKKRKHDHILNLPVMQDEICDKFPLVMLHGNRFLVDFKLSEHCHTLKFLVKIHECDEFCDNTISFCNVT